MILAIHRKFKNFLSQSALPETFSEKLTKFRQAKSLKNSKKAQEFSCAFKLALSDILGAKSAKVRQHNRYFTGFGRYLTPETSPIAINILTTELPP